MARSNDKENMLRYLENCPLRDTRAPDVVTAILGCIGKRMNKKDLERIQNKGTGEYDMCKALRDMIDEGISIGKNEGISIGRNEGILEGTIRTLYNLVKTNIIPLTIAAEQAAVTEERFMELVEHFQPTTNS